MEPLDIDVTLNRVITVKREIAQLEAELSQHLDALSEAMASSELDPSFSYNDVSFNWNPGKVSYDYPQPVVTISQQLKQAQADAVANGSARLKRGAPFWTVRMPK